MNEAFDPRLNDAYVRAVFRAGRTGLYPQATGAYLDLFEQASQVPAADPKGRQIIGRHVSQMAFLLSGGARSRLLRTVDQEKVVAPAYALRSGKGPALAGWWRGQDPVPRTARNERVEEHLRRVQVAKKKYGFEDRWRDFDERGEIYVRLGPPGQTREVSFAGLKRHKFPDAPIKGIETGLPKHEIWLYPEHGEDALYIFVWRQGRYRLSGPQALLPTDVRGPYDGGERGEAKLAVLAMERILDQLRVNSEYSRLYWSVSDYISRLGIPGATGGPAGAGGEKDKDSQGIPSPSNSEEKGGGEPPKGASIQKAQRAHPYVFAQTAQLSTETTKRRVARARRRTVPRQETDVGEDLPRVPVRLRRARFLDEDGTTRTLLYWTHPTEKLEEKALFSVTAIQRRRDYTRMQQRSRRYVMDPAQKGLQAWVLPMRGGKGTYHLHLQVDQYGVKDVSGAGGVRRGKRRAQTVVRLDSLEALEAEAGQLAMSDLLPGLPPSRSPGAEETTPGRMALSPYPYGTLFPGVKLRLYFEVYGLAFGSGDRTRYSVAYEVEKRSEGGAFRLFRDETRMTTTRSTYEGTRRRTQEYIQLRLGEIRAADEVRITVQVTDEVTDQSAERSLTFDVAK